MRRGGLARRAWAERTAAALATAAALLVGCDGKAMFLARNQREIDAASRALDAARDDAARARAHSARGHGWSERARYQKAFKLVDDAEYRRLFDLAVADHERALALAPADAQAYVDRGQTYYDRAALEPEGDPARRAHFAAAEADFGRAIERDRALAHAYDMRGLVRLATRDVDGALADFTVEAALEPRLGRARLAEAHCNRGVEELTAKRVDAAVADLEKAVALGGSGDGCECQPESPLAGAYLERKEYDRSWAVVRAAQAEHRWIMPELVERLRKESGRER